MLKIILGSILSGVKAAITQISLVVLGILYLVLIFNGEGVFGAPFKPLGYIVVFGWVLTIIRTAAAKRGERNE